VGDAERRGERAQADLLVYSCLLDVFSYRHVTALYTTTPRPSTPPQRLPYKPVNLSAISALDTTSRPCSYALRLLTSVQDR
jgi:hypothetical protein